MSIKTTSREADRIEALRSIRWIRMQINDGGLHTFLGFHKDYDIAGLQRICQTVIDTDVFYGEEKRWAQEVLEVIGDTRVEAICLEAKALHTRRRRSQFSRDHDRLMLALIERDGYRCATCGAVETLTIDHIDPLSKGGSDDLDNLQLLCRSCNSRKGHSGRTMHDVEHGKGG